MRTTTIKLFTIALFALPLSFLMGFKATPVIGASSTADDPAAEFKAKCAACHTPTASKFYDPAKTDEEHVQTILKGKKGEKPPYMPGFEAKGMTEDGAKALAAYMKTLKPAS
jgi:mono/diheme cytochrome c family protein